MIETSTPSERRHLSFATAEDVLNDIDKILAAELGGRLRTIGTWTPGQIMAHVAAWIDYGYIGYPVKAPPFFIRWILRLKLKQILAKGMPAGIRIPGVKDGTIGQDPMTSAEAATRLKRSFLRLANGEQCPFESPGFGAMSHEQRIKLNLRHAELHLSFINV